MSKKAPVSFLSFCICLAALFAQPLYSQTDQFPRGVVIKSVASLENKEQSYALYLPSNYSPEKKWPTLYIFDPEGKGDQPVGIFRAAAEKYGFIVVGSNNNRNGLGPAIQTEAIKALWKDTHARFVIDERRTYAAGFSGGARLANNFAYSCKGCIAAVVSCGAAFPPEFPLDKNLPYAIFGTTGYDDFNYPEMIKLDRTLTKLGVPHHVARFEGEHQWLSGELTFEALEWFDQQAMKSGRLAKNTTFINEILAKREAEADKAYKNGQLLEAYDQYASLARNFTGLADVSKITGKLDRIAEEKNYKETLARENESFARQMTTARRIFSQAADLLDPAAKSKTAGAISAELSKLRETAEARADSEERRFARRTLRALLAESNESAMHIYMQKKDYKSAAANFELAALVYPKSMYIELNLARALVLDGREKEAVEALSRAVEKGLKDCTVLTKDKVFNSLQTNKDFQKVMAAINCPG